MRHRRGFFLIAFLALAALALGLPSPSAADDEAALWQKIKDPDTFAVMRHALAPGFGDPDNFRSGDCTTQRNLDAVGRRQAKRTGDLFRAAGITKARVYSSAWCRCIETAELLRLGPVETLSALNSLHARPEDRAPNMKRMKEFLATVPRSGPPVVLSTHQTVIRALTGQGAMSGEIVVFRADADGAVSVLGAIRTDGGT